jgi:hypothetical protein
MEDETRVLSLTIDQIPGNARCHWSLIIHRPGSETGHLFQVLPLDPSNSGGEKERLYVFDSLRDAEILNPQSEGSVIVAHMSGEQSHRTVRVIKQEPPPGGGVGAGVVYGNGNGVVDGNGEVGHPPGGSGAAEGCQEWCLRAIISLEAEECLPPGTAAWVANCVGLSAEGVRRRVGERWIGVGVGVGVDEEKV